MLDVPHRVQDALAAIACFLTVARNSRASRLPVEEPEGTAASRHFHPRYKGKRRRPIEGICRQNR